VPFTDPAPFFNVNTPADWAEARRLLGDPFKHAPGGAAQPADDLEARNGEDVPGRRVGEPVVLGVVGRPNSGKTTLIERLIPEFTRRGLRVGAVKRVARFDIDVPGKDSWRHGQAGADAYTVASSSKLAYVARRDEEATLDEIVSRYFAGYDLVICEGYRREAPHVVEVFRPRARAPLRARRQRGAREVPAVHARDRRDRRVAAPASARPAE
jgi:molybdopterin-guanine dinucleotide biosynthesis protein MobB